MALSFTSAVDEYGSFRFDQGLLPKDSMVVSVVTAVEESPSPSRHPARYITHPINSPYYTPYQPI